MRSVVATLAALLWAGPAPASCHLMEVVEIFGGTSADPNAHYVVLRMTFANQTAIVATSITATGGTFGTFSMSLMGPAAAGSRILMATAEAEALLSITADQTAPGAVLLGLPADLVTYTCSGDMVMYGAGSIPELIPGCALKKSGMTWSLGDPTPTNYAGSSGSLPGSCVPPDAGVPEPEPDLGMDAGPADAAMADAPPVDMAPPPDSLVPDIQDPDLPPADTATPPDTSLADAPADEPVDKPPDTDEGSGCSCRLASAPATTAGRSLWLATVLVLAKRRKRA